MTDLSDTARVVLVAAARRDDLSVLPFPPGCRAKGGAKQKVLDGLNKRGLIRVIGADGGPERVVITSAGMAAVGVEVEEYAPPGAAENGTPVARADTDVQSDGAPTQAPVGDHTVSPAETTSEATTAKHGKAAPAEKRTRSSRTKQALMIEMLMRPEGATVAQIAIATGWQHHTIRGAISGTLKKKLGLVVEATREPGSNEAGAKDRATVYRITGLEGCRDGYRAT
jgi:hypothetical protein